MKTAPDATGNLEEHPANATGSRSRDTSFPASVATLDYGVVAWFNRELGFGFITPDEDGPDVFVHLSEIPHVSSGVPKVGQRVSYRMGGTTRRPEARTVHLL